MKRCRTVATDVRELAEVAQPHRLRMVDARERLAQGRSVHQRVVVDEHQKLDAGVATHVRRCVSQGGQESVLSIQRALAVCIVAQLAHLHVPGVLPRQQVVGIVAAGRAARSVQLRALRHVLVPGHELDPGMRVGRQRQRSPAVGVGHASGNARMRARGRSAAVEPAARQLTGHDREQYADAAGRRRAGSLQFGPRGRRLALVGRRAAPQVGKARPGASGRVALEQLRLPCGGADLRAFERRP